MKICVTKSRQLCGLGKKLALSGRNGGKQQDWLSLEVEMSDIFEAQQ